MSDIPRRGDCGADTQAFENNVATNQFEVFEFDKNNVFIDNNLDMLPDYRLIPITDLSTREQVASQIVVAIEISVMSVNPTINPVAAGHATLISRTGQNSPGRILA